MKKVLGIGSNLVLVISILLLAIILRVFYLNNTVGLTISETAVFNDLYNPFDINIWKSLLHAEPIFSLYTLFASFLNNFFENNAIYLRLLSVTFGVVTCFTSYFLQEKLQGYVCLLLFSLNSFLINYSQEVGMYALLGLFATLNIICLLKIKDTDKGYFLWILSIFGMGFTSVFTILFSFVEIILFVICKRNRKIFISSVLALSSLVPFLVYFIFNLKKYCDYYLGINYDYASIFAFIQNFLTPKLIELNLNNFINYFYNTYFEINFYTLAFIIIPLLIVLYFIVKSCVNYKFNILLLILGFIYISIRFFLQYAFGVPFAMGEYIVVLPVVLIVMSMGIEKDVLSISLIATFLVINLFYLVSQDNSAFKNKRVSVFGVADIINMSVKDNDAVLTWINLAGLEGAIDKKIRIENLSDDYTKGNQKVFEGKINFSKMSEKEKKDFMRDYFLNRRYSKNMIFKTNILMSFIPNGGHIYVVYPKKYDYDYDKFLDIVSKDYLYYKYAYKDLMLMHTIIQLQRILSDYYERRDEKDNFVINIYKK